MPKYDVHLLSVVRFTVRNVEAGSMEEACKTAEQDLSDETIRRAMRGASEHEAEFADEVLEALVDIQGDEEHSQSSWFKPSGEIWVEKDVMEMDAPNHIGCRKLLTAAKRVVANWERGDLAAAVRELDLSIQEVGGKADDIDLTE